MPRCHPRGVGTVDPGAAGGGCGGGKGSLLDQATPGINRKHLHQGRRNTIERGSISARNDARRFLSLIALKTGTDCHPTQEKH